MDTKSWYPLEFIYDDYDHNDVLHHFMLIMTTMMITVIIMLEGMEHYV